MPSSKLTDAALCGGTRVETVDRLKKDFSICIGVDVAIGTISAFDVLDAASAISSIGAFGDSAIATFFGLPRLFFWGIFGSSGIACVTTKSSSANWFSVVVPSSIPSIITSVRVAASTVFLFCCVRDMTCINSASLMDFFGIRTGRTKIRWLLRLISHSLPISLGPSFKLIFFSAVAAVAGFEIFFAGIESVDLLRLRPVDSPGDFPSSLRCFIESVRANGCLEFASGWFVIGATSVSSKRGAARDDLSSAVRLRDGSFGMRCT